MRAVDLAGVDGDLEAGVERAPKVLAKAPRREALLVARQVDRDQVVAVGQQRVQFVVAGLRVVGAAEDADHLRAHAGVALGRADAVGDRLDHPFRRQAVRLGHEPGAEAQFDVVEPLVARVLDVLVGDAAAGVEVGQDRRQPAEAADEVHQAGRAALDHDVRAQGGDLVGRQLDAVAQRQFHHRLQPDRAVEVAMQVDQRNSGIDVRIGRHGRVLHSNVF